MNGTLRRCPWAERSEIERDYHDRVWGVPLHDEKGLFKMLCLEAMQAGLSWVTILKKMNALSSAFDDFDATRMVAYDERKIAVLMETKGIIRNRLKIRAMIANAGALLRLKEVHGSLDAFLWRYVDFRPILNEWHDVSEVPARTPLSARIGNDLKKHGFRFVGPTIVYSFMQAVGMVNDHLLACPFRNTPSGGAASLVCEERRD